MRTDKEAIRVSENDDFHTGDKVEVLNHQFAQPIGRIIEKFTFNGRNCYRVMMFLDETECFCFGCELALTY